VSKVFFNSLPALKRRLWNAFLTCARDWDGTGVRAVAVCRRAAGTPLVARSVPGRTFRLFSGLLMSRFTPFLALVVLTACQSGPRGEDGSRFYSYMDAQGNLVTVQSDADSDVDNDANRAPDQSDNSSLPKDTDQSFQERPREAGAQGRVNKEFMNVRPEGYATPKQAQERLDEAVDDEEDDRFVSYRGPEGQIITRPLDLEAEREAAEQRQRERRPDFERLPEGDRYKEGTTRVPADCCRHLIDGAPTLTVNNNFTLDFGTAPVVRLDAKRPARALELGPGVGALEVQSYIQERGYFAPRLLFLDSEGMPVLKVNRLFTRHYPETWARYAYMDGWVERSSRDFAYVVFYLPYARVRGQALQQHPGQSPAASDYRRALKGELAVTARVERNRANSKASPD
jgi:hypothetical protein